MRRVHRARGRLGLRKVGGQRGTATGDWMRRHLVGRGRGGSRGGGGGGVSRRGLLGAE